MADLFSEFCKLNMERSSSEANHLGILKELSCLSDHPNSFDGERRLCIFIRLWVCLKKNSFKTKHVEEAFCTLLRKTALFILSSHWDKVSTALKRELLENVQLCGRLLNTWVKYSMKKCSDIQALSVNPWNNPFVSWPMLLAGELNLDDANVQAYLRNEPEEVVLSRIHFLTVAGCAPQALYLVKYMFRYYSGTCKKHNHAQHMNEMAKHMILGNRDNRSEYASLQWFLFLLQRKKTLPEIARQVVDLNAHEALHVVTSLRKKPETRHYADLVLQIFLVQEVVEPKTYCCLRELFKIWCLSLKEKKLTLHELADSCRKLLGRYASTSAHFYLLIDVLWDQFEHHLLPLYVELFVRAVTVDINHLEVARNVNSKLEMGELEAHLADMFAKHALLFLDHSEIVARECFLSAFSLRPTNERLCILQSLTSSILSSRYVSKESSTYSDGGLYSAEPEAGPSPNTLNNCSSSMHYTKTYHPLLSKGIQSIPYSIVLDMVIILESVRPSVFQFNEFNWESAVTELGDYFKEWRTRLMIGDDEDDMSGSDTESFSEDSSMVNSLPCSLNAQQNAVSNVNSYLSMPAPAVKSEEKEVIWPSTDFRNPHFVAHVAANVEVGSDSESSVCERIAASILKNRLCASKTVSSSGVPMPDPKTNLSPVVRKQEGSLQAGMPLSPTNFTMLEKKGTNIQSVPDASPKAVPKTVSCSSAYASYLGKQGSDFVKKCEFPGLSSSKATTSYASDVPRISIEATCTARSNAGCLNSDVPRPRTCDPVPSSVPSTSALTVHPSIQSSVPSSNLNALEGLGSAHHVIGSHASSLMKSNKIKQQVQFVKPKSKAIENFVIHRQVLVEPSKVNSSQKVIGIKVPKKQNIPIPSTESALASDPDCFSKKLEEDDWDRLGNHPKVDVSGNMSGSGENSKAPKGIFQPILRTALQNLNMPPPRATSQFPILNSQKVISLPHSVGESTVPCTSEQKVVTSSVDRTTSVIQHTKTIQSPTVSEGSSSHRIPVPISINQIRSTNQMPKMFPIKISLPPDYPLSNTTMLSANLVIPCTGSEAGSNSSQSAQLHNSSAKLCSKTITIPGVVVQVKKRPPGNEGSISIVNQSKSSWTTLRSVHGQVDYKKLDGSSAPLVVPGTVPVRSPVKPEEAIPMPLSVPVVSETRTTSHSVPQNAASDVQGVSVACKPSFDSHTPMNETFKNSDLIHNPVAEQNDSVSSSDPDEPSRGIHEKLPISNPMSGCVNKNSGVKRDSASSSLSTTSCFGRLESGSIDSFKSLQESILDHKLAMNEIRTTGNTHLPPASPKLISSSVQKPSISSAGFLSPERTPHLHDVPPKPDFKPEICKSETGCDVKDQSIRNQVHQQPLTVDKIKAWPSSSSDSSPVQEAECSRMNPPNIPKSRYFSPIPVPQSPTSNSRMCCSPHEINPCQSCSSSRGKTPVHMTPPSPKVKAGATSSEMTSPVNQEMESASSIQQPVHAPCDNSSTIAVPKTKEKRKFSCFVCGKLLASRYTLKSHVRKFHAEECEKGLFDPSEAQVNFMQNVSGNSSIQGPKKRQKASAQSHQNSGQYDNCDNSNIVSSSSNNGSSVQDGTMNDSLENKVIRYFADFLSNTNDNDSSTGQNIIDALGVEPSDGNSLADVTLHNVNNESAEIVCPSLSGNEENLTLPTEPTGIDNYGYSSENKSFQSTELQSSWQVAGSAMQCLNNPFMDDSDFFSDFHSSSPDIFARPVPPPAGSGMAGDNGLAYNVDCPSFPLNNSDESFEQLRDIPKGTCNDSKDPFASIESSMLSDTCADREFSGKSPAEGQEWNKGAVTSSIDSYSDSAQGSYSCDVKRESKNNFLPNSSSLPVREESDRISLKNNVNRGGGDADFQSPCRSFESPNPNHIQSSDIDSFSPTYSSSSGLSSPSCASVSEQVPIAPWKQNTKKRGHQTARKLQVSCKICQKILRYASFRRHMKQVHKKDYSVTLKATDDLKTKLFNVCESSSVSSDAEIPNAVQISSPTVRNKSADIFSSPPRLSPHITNTSTNILDSTNVDEVGFADPVHDGLNEPCLPDIRDEISGLDILSPHPVNDMFKDELSNDMPGTSSVDPSKTLNDTGQVNGSKYSEVVSGSTLFNALVGRVHSEITAEELNSSHNTQPVPYQASTESSFSETGQKSWEWEQGTEVDLGRLQTETTPDSMTSLYIEEAASQSEVVDVHSESTDKSWASRRATETVQEALPTQVSSSPVLGCSYAVGPAYSDTEGERVPSETGDKPWQYQKATRAFSGVTNPQTSAANTSTLVSVAVHSHSGIAGINASVASNSAASKAFIVKQGKRIVERNFSCTMCSKKFSSEASRKRHVKNVHKNSSEESERKKRDLEEECDRKVRSIVERITLETRMKEEEKKRTSTVVPPKKLTQAPLVSISECTVTSSLPSNSTVVGVGVVRGVPVINGAIAGKNVFLTHTPRPPGCASLSSVNNETVVILPVISSSSNANVPSPMVSQVLRSSHFISPSKPSLLSSTEQLSDLYPKIPSRETNVVESRNLVQEDDFSSSIENTIDNLQPLLQENLMADSKAFNSSANKSQQSMQNVQSSTQPEFIGLDKLVMQYLNDPENVEIPSPMPTVQGIDFKTEGAESRSVQYEQSLPQNQVVHDPTRLPPRMPIVFSPVHVNRDEIRPLDQNTIIKQQEVLKETFMQWKLPNSSSVGHTGISMLIPQESSNSGTFSEFDSSSSDFLSTVPVSKLSNITRHVTTHTLGGSTAVQPNLSNICNNNTTTVCESVHLKSATCTASSNNLFAVPPKQETESGTPISTKVIPAVDVLQSSPVGKTPHLQSVPTLSNLKSPTSNSSNGTTGHKFLAGSPALSSSQQVLHSHEFQKNGTSDVNSSGSYVCANQIGIQPIHPASSQGCQLPSVLKAVEIQSSVHKPTNIGTAPQESSSSVTSDNFRGTSQQSSSICFGSNNLCPPVVASANWEVPRSPGLQSISSQCLSPSPEKVISMPVSTPNTTKNNFQGVGNVISASGISLPISAPTVGSALLHSVHANKASDASKISSSFFPDSSKTVISVPPVENKANLCLQGTGINNVTTIPSSNDSSTSTATVTSAVIPKTVPRKKVVERKKPAAVKSSVTTKSSTSKSVIASASSSSKAIPAVKASSTVSSAHSSKPVVIAKNCLGGSKETAVKHHQPKVNNGMCLMPTAVASRAKHLHLHKSAASRLPKPIKSPEVKLVRLNRSMLETSGTTMVLSRLESKNTVGVAVLDANGNRTSLHRHDLVKVTKILSRINNAVVPAKEEKGYRKTSSLNLSKKEKPEVRNLAKEEAEKPSEKDAEKPSEKDAAAIGVKVSDEDVTEQKSVEIPSVESNNKPDSRQQTIGKNQSGKRKKQIKIHKDVVFENSSKESQEINCPKLVLKKVRVENSGKDGVQYYVPATEKVEDMEVPPKGNEKLGEEKQLDALPNSPVLHQSLAATTENSLNSNKKRKTSKTVSCRDKKKNVKKVLGKQSRVPPSATFGDPSKKRKQKVSLKVSTKKVTSEVSNDAKENTDIDSTTGKNLADSYETTVNKNFDQNVASTESTTKPSVTFSKAVKNMIKKKKIPVALAKKRIIKPRGSKTKPSQVKASKRSKSDMASDASGISIPLQEQLDPVCEGHSEKPAPKTTSKSSSLQKSVKQKIVKIRKLSSKKRKPSTLNSSKITVNISASTEERRANIKAPTKDRACNLNMLLKGKNACKKVNAKSCHRQRAKSLVAKKKNCVTNVFAEEKVPLKTENAVEALPADKGSDFVASDFKPESTFLENTYQCKETEQSCKDIVEKPVKVVRIRSSLRGRKKKQKHWSKVPKISVKQLSTNLSEDPKEGPATQENVGESVNSKLLQRDPGEETTEETVEKSEVQPSTRSYPLKKRKEMYEKVLEKEASISLKDSGPSVINSSVNSCSENKSDIDAENICSNKTHENVEKAWEKKAKLYKTRECTVKLNKVNFPVANSFPKAKSSDSHNEKSHGIDKVKDPSLSSEKETVQESAYHTEKCAGPKKSVSSLPKINECEVVLKKLPPDFALKAFKQKEKEEEVCAIESSDSEKYSGRGLLPKQLRSRRKLVSHRVWSSRTVVAKPSEAICITLDSD